VSTIVAIGVIIIGVAAVVVILRQSVDGGGTSLLQRPKKQSTTELLEQATSTVQPLAPWSPPDSLQPWSPPSDLEAPAPPADEPQTFTEPQAFDTTRFDQPSTTEAPNHDDFWAPSEAPPSDFSDLAPATDSGESDGASWLDDPFGSHTDAPNEDTWGDGSTWDDGNVAVDTNPLDEIKALDDVDVIAEFERLEARETLAEPEFEVESLAPPADASTDVLDELAIPINEDVSSADDILAASQATELHMTEDNGENSELAKLLAKVQARLAAYE
jgi:hypothetical protein